MSATCHAIPQAVAQDILQGVVFAICDRPGETAARRDALSRGVVHSVLSFQPRDGVEIMLAGMVVSHFHLILDSAHDVFRGGQQDAHKARTKSGIVALGRAMAGLLKELRTARTRPAEGAAGETRQNVHADAAPPAAAKSEAEPVKPAQSAGTSRRDPDVSPDTGAPAPLLTPPRRGETSAAAMMAALAPLLTPPRRGETSAAAMMAVMSPTTKPHLAGAALKQVNMPANVTAS